MRRLILIAAATVVAYAAQDAGFVGLVGNWKVVDDGGVAFKVDTAGWSGATDRAAIEPIVRSLFPAVNDTFFANATSRQAFPLAVFTSVKDFTGGTIKVSFKLLGGATDKNAGIVFGLKPNGEYYFVRYNTLDGNIALWRFRNGARARVAEAPVEVQLPLAVWHELAIAIDGTRLKATVNRDVLEHEFTLPEPVSGRVGLWTKRDAITTFRAFRVTP